MNIRVCRLRFVRQPGRGRVHEPRAAAAAPPPRRDLSRVVGSEGAGTARGLKSSPPWWGCHGGRVRSVREATARGVPGERRFTVKEEHLPTMK